MKALQLFAGPAALAHLREHGLRPQHVRAIPAAAGGPKGLILGPLDRFLFGHWLPQASQREPMPEHTPEQTIHLLGASIGAWRMAAACMPDADAALARLSEDYITQRYAHAPEPAEVSRAFGAKLQEHFGGQEAALLAHPRYRLHVFTSHGQGLLARETSGWRTGLGYGAAFFSNLASRRALGGWLERVVFSDSREPLPLPLHDLRSRQVPLTPANLAPAVLASCSIPFWLKAVHDIPGAPPGAYWDGGITDYHLHLRYDQMAHRSLGHSAGPGASEPGLVLYPHFQPNLVPGWLDKALKPRHRATPALSRVLLLAPRPEWIATLPNGKLPDRADFKTYADDEAGREKVWRRAVAESQRLADELADWLAGSGAPELRPLP